MKKKDTFPMYALLAGLLMIIASVTIYVTNSMFVKGLQYVPYLLLLLALILNARAYSKANDGFVTFGNVFGSGFKLTAIVTAIMIIWCFASLYIFPEMKDKIMENTQKEMAKQQKMTDEQMEMALNVTKKYWTYFLVGGTLFMTFFIGTIFSLIAAATAPKKGERPFTADNF